MSVRLLTCAVVGLVLAAGPAAAADPPKPGTTEHILDVLRQRVSFDRVNETSLYELLQQLAGKYEVTFVIQDEAFKAADVPGIREERPRFTATKISGMTLHRFLTLVLKSMNGAYLVRKDHIEIVPAVYAAEDMKAVRTGMLGFPRYEQLVAVAYKEKPLNEALADLAEEYDLTVVVSPQAGDARMGFVNARLLNVPADKAVELLAVQADLRVVRRGTAYLVTSKDHAEAMAGERIEKERQRIELGWMRKGPPPLAPKPPEPEPKKEP